MIISHSLRNLMLPLDRIDASLPESGIIYDVGCGMGVISRYLAKRSQRTIIGVDLRLDKTDIANTSFNLSFVEADAIKFGYKSMIGAVLSDFLHHLPFNSQDQLLTRLTKKIKPGGILVIKEIDQADGWRRLASRLWDFLFYPEDRIYYREKSELRRYLEHLDFRVETSREVPWFPGSTHLFICRKV